MNTIGKLLFEYRKQLNITQKNLVEELSHFSPNFKALNTVTLSRWETGTTTPSLNKKRILLDFFTLSGKENMNLFLAGLIVGVLSSIIFWVFEWRRLNKAAAGEFRSMQVTRRKKVINYLIIFGLVAVIIFVTAFLLVSISGYYAFLSGLFLFVWTQYLEVVYWERKNRKILIVEKTSFYAVDIKAVGSE